MSDCLTTRPRPFCRSISTRGEKEFCLRSGAGSLGKEDEELVDLEGEALDVNLSYPKAGDIPGPGSTCPLVTSSCEFPSPAGTVQGLPGILDIGGLIRPPSMVAGRISPGFPQDCPLAGASRSRSDRPSSEFASQTLRTTMDDSNCSLSSSMLDETDFSMSMMIYPAITLPRPTHFRLQ